MPAPLLRALLLILLAVPPGHALEWASVGPEGGWIQVLQRTDTGRLVIGAWGSGVYVSEDRGTTWQLLGSEGLPTARIESLAVDPVDPQTLFVGLRLRGLYKTIDGGASWLPLTEGPAGSVGAIHIDPVDPQRLLAGGSGVHLSQDGGTTWVQTGLEGQVLRALESTPGGQTLFAVTGSSGLFRSDDRGLTWKQTFSPVLEVAVNPVHPSTVFACGNGLHRSDDGGQTWQPLDSLKPSCREALAVSPRPHLPGNETVLVGTAGEGLYQTVDGGVSWSAVEGSPRHHGLTGLVGLSDGAWVASTVGGMVRGDSQGWQTINHGIDAGLTNTILIDPGSPDRVLLAQLGGGVYERLEDWRLISEDLPARANQIEEIALSDEGSERLFAATRSGVYGLHEGLWERLPTPGNLQLAFTVLVDGDDPAHLYTGGYNRAYRSQDHGQSWQTMTGDSLDSVLSSAWAPTDPPTVYLGTEGPGVYRSRDQGVTWERINEGLLNFLIQTIEIDAHEPTRLYVGTSRGIFRSDDGGDGWIPVRSGLEDLWIDDLASDPRNLGVVYAATVGRGVWVTEDFGSTWERLGPTPGNGFVRALAFGSGAVLYAGTEGSGLWSLELPRLFSDGFESGDASAWDVVSDP